MPSMRRLWIVDFALIFLASASLNIFQMQLPRPEKIEIPLSGVTMPMGDIGGRPLVDVRINGRGPYPFILDTGASIITINEDLIRELALPSGAENMSPATWRVEELRVAGATLRGVIVVPSPPMMGNLGGSMQPRGILSALYFPGALITLDYPGKRVNIRNGDLPSPDNRRVFAYAPDDSLPRIPIQIAGQEFRPHVDSGSPSGLTLPMKFSNALPLAGKLIEAGKARAPSGEYLILSGMLAAPVQLGEYQLDVKQIRFSDLRPGADPAVGNLGYKFLKDFVITLDSANRRLKFERP